MIAVLGKNEIQVLLAVEPQPDIISESYIALLRLWPVVAEAYGITFAHTE